jgi:phosphate starvation-inducible PhoH-like protein
MAEETQRSLSLDGIDLLHLFGQADSNLRAIEQRFRVSTVLRNGSLSIRGDTVSVDSAVEVIRLLGERARSGNVIGGEDLSYVFSLIEESAGNGETPLDAEAQIILAAEKKIVRARTVGQAQYVEAMRTNDIVFGIGPAGTGKTYLAVAVAVRMLREKAVDRIVLARPAVEAGESLGYLPGDLQEKVDPYLRPLYDALHEMVSYEKLQRFIQLGVVEVAPLAYMRGRTLGRAFVILDEAQNTTLGQMKMFLTRLGPDSKAAITGDVTQVDIPDPESSGLIRIQSILKDLQGVRFVYLTEKDVVRHRLVRDIILAFDRLAPATDKQVRR